MQKDQYIHINFNRDGRSYKRYYSDKEMTVRHRVDGPAVEWSNGSKFWYINGKRHRTDGPAVEWSNGEKEWYINDQSLTETRFNARMNPEPITMEQISEKFGIPLDKLRIRD